MEQARLTTGPPCPLDAVTYIYRACIAFAGCRFEGWGAAGYQNLASRRTCGHVHNKYVQLNSQSETLLPAWLHGVCMGKWACMAAWGLHGQMGPHGCMASHVQYLVPRTYAFTGCQGQGRANQHLLQYEHPIRRSYNKPWGPPN